MITLYLRQEHKIYPMKSVFLYFINLQEHPIANEIYFCYFNDFITLDLP